LATLTFTFTFTFPEKGEVADVIQYTPSGDPVASEARFAEGGILAITADVLPGVTVGSPIFNGNEEVAGMVAAIKQDKVASPVSMRYASGVLAVAGVLR
jgi:hypothetical protein